MALGGGQMDRWMETGENPKWNHRSLHWLGLEQDGHEGWNSYDFALKSNSTACKILPVRLNATFYYPGSGTNA